MNNRILSTKEFTEIAVKGMMFQTDYNGFDGYPFENGEIITYIETLNNCIVGYCNKFTRGECKGRGVFRRSDGEIKKTCMSWTWESDLISNELGCTHLRIIDEFISEDEFEI